MTSEDDRREAHRRERDRRAAGRTLVPTDAPAQADAPAPGPDPAPTARRPAGAIPDPAFSAQLMGQDGQRRGLKGGPPVLDAARSGYLSTEHSGPHERRPRPGTVTKSDV